jgi:hypothetical protein
MYSNLNKKEHYKIHKLKWIINLIKMKNLFNKKELFI